MKVALIGLGRMGAAIGERLLAAGYELTVYNRSPEKLQPLVARGARAAGSVAEAAREGGPVITMLANDEALAAVAFGPDGLVAALPPGGLHVAMGTHQVDAVQALADAHDACGQAFLAAPVVGRPEAVRAGQLGIIVGGPAAPAAAAAALFHAIGRRTFAAGETPASAALLKLTNNLVLACAIEVMGEAFSLVRKSGADPGALREVLVEGLFGCPAYDRYSQIILQQAFDEVGITATLGLKDVTLALAAGAAVGVPLPSAEVCRMRLQGALDHGEGALDWSVMSREQARAAGLAPLDDFAPTPGPQDP